MPVILLIFSITSITFWPFSNNEQIKEFLIPNERVQVIHTPYKLDMGEKNPVLAIRSNKELSLVNFYCENKNKILGNELNQENENGLALSTAEGIEFSFAWESATVERVIEVLKNGD